MYLSFLFHFDRCFKFYSLYDEFSVVFFCLFFQMEHSDLNLHFNKNVYPHMEFLLNEMQTIKIDLYDTKVKLDKAEKEIIKLNSHGARGELTNIFIF